MTDEQAAELIVLMKDIRARLETAVPRCGLCNINPRQNADPYCVSCAGNKILSDLRSYGAIS